MRELLLIFDFPRIVSRDRIKLPRSNLKWHDVKECMQDERKDGKKAREFNHKKYCETIKEKETMKIYFIVAKKKHQNIVNCLLVCEH
jgi:hypothetical protein